MTKQLEAPPTVAIVVPCFREESAVPVTAKTLCEYLAELVINETVSKSSFVLFVDDGSDDATWERLVIIAERWASARLLRLSANFGHQAAIVAGIAAVNPLVDAVVTIDADLQDDITILPEMLTQFGSGAGVVAGVRQDRASDSFWKRTAAEGYYRLARKLGVPLILQHADYRLLSQDAATRLLEYREHSIFLRAIVPSLSNNVRTVTYDRTPREHGRSKYSVGKMFRLAIAGIVGYSAAPLRAVFLGGFFGLVLSGGAVLYAIAGYIRGVALPGWTSLLVYMSALFSLQFLAVGILGGIRKADFGEYAW